MKKYFLYGAGILAVALAVFLTVSNTGRANKSDFFRWAVAADPASRRSFEVDAAADRIFFLNKEEPLELKGIPSANACYFKLEGRKDFTLPVPFTGACGLYTHVFLSSLNGERIRFRIGVKRKGRTFCFKQMHSKEFNAPVFQFLTLAGGDTLEMSCQGTGIVYFSRPVLYRIKDEGERDYVFLIGVDTFRADHVGLMVNGRSLTPNIDRFKGDSVDFSRCYSQSSWTLPAFMSLFTAQYEFQHRMSRRSALDPGKPFLVKELAEKFITLNINGGIYMSKNFGFARHFDYFETCAPLAGPSGGRVLFTKALDLIGRSRFPASFMFLHTYQTHSPYAPPPEFLKEIDPAPLHSELKSIPFGLQNRRYIEVDDALKRSYRELYQAEVLAFDSFFGDFISRLKRMGIFDRSMIVLMSDHGEEFFDHRGWDHGHSLYDELLHVPLIIKFPGNKNRGLKVSTNVGVIDILPTILAGTGLTASAGPLDGNDLTPLMASGKLERPELLSSAANCRFLKEIPPKFAIFSGRFKVICNYEYSAKDLKFFQEYTLPPVTGPVEIYDLEHDPLERMNLFPQRKDIYVKVSRRLNQVRSLVDAALAGKKKQRQGKIDDDLQKQLKSLGYI